MARLSMSIRRQRTGFEFRIGASLSRGASVEEDRRDDIDRALGSRVLATVTVDPAHHAQQRFGRDSSVDTRPYRTALDAVVENSADQSRQVTALSLILALLRGAQRLGIAQQGEELAAAPEESQRMTDDRRDLLAHRRASGQRRANFAPQFGESVDYRGRVELLFRFELTVNAALANPGVSGDLVDQYQLEFPFSKEFRGAQEDSLADERRGRPATAFFAANRRRNRLALGAHDWKPAIIEFVD